MFDALAAPFPADDISWRVGPTNERSRREDQPLRGQPLCYIDARTVMDRLDSVIGFEHWQTNYTPGVGTSIVCNIGIRIAGEWVWKADGAGPSDMEADKGALSDAFKRAAVRWGIGRYLYDIKAHWITLEKRGNTAFIPDAEYPNLAKIHEDMAKRVGWGNGYDISAYRLLLAELDGLPPPLRESFPKRRANEIAMLPPAMRRHLIGRMETKAA